MSKGLLRSSLVVAFFTFCSRILGFIRDMVIARFFGASVGVDAFLVANQIPNFMRRLFAEGAFAQAFVPVLSDYKAGRNAAETQAFIAKVMGNLAMSLALVTFIALLLAPLLIMVVAPGFLDDVRFSLATVMVRITFPYLFLISLTALCGAVLNTYGRFAIPAFTPVLLNVVLIASTLWLAPHLAHPVMALAWGVLMAGVVQLLFQFPSLKRAGFLQRPRIDWHDSGVRQVLRSMAPAIFGVSVAQVNMLIDNLLASFLHHGSVSWLYYSERLNGLPLGVFAVAAATVVLPTLSKQCSHGSKQGFSQTLDWGLRFLLILGLPATLGLIVLAFPLLITLFYRGAFHLSDVLMTQKSLISFAVGLQAFMVIKVLAAGFYAHKNIRLPVKVAVIAMITNTLLSLALIHSLAHAGLALASSLAGFVNAGLLFYHLRCSDLYQPQKGWGRFIMQVAFALAVMLSWLLWQMPQHQLWLEHSTTWRAGHLSYLIGSAIGLYLLALLVSGMRLRHFSLEFR